MFRVRVGTFKTRSEAQTVADKLKKEEKFKPWVAPLRPRRSLAVRARRHVGPPARSSAFQTFGHPALAWVALAPLLVALPARHACRAPSRSGSHRSHLLHRHALLDHAGHGRATAALRRSWRCSINALLDRLPVVVPGALRDDRRPLLARSARAPAGRAVRVGGHRTWPDLHLHRFSMGAARVQPGDATCRLRSWPRCSACTACRPGRWCQRGTGIRGGGHGPLTAGPRRRQAAPRPPAGVPSLLLMLALVVGIGIWGSVARQRAAN